MKTNVASRDKLFAPLRQQLRITMAMMSLLIGAFLIVGLTFPTTHSPTSSEYIKPQSSAAITGDINGNGSVEIFDLGILASNYNQIVTPQSGSLLKACDLNNSGKVDVFDLGLLMSHYGQRDDVTPTITHAPTITTTPGPSPTVGTPTPTSPPIQGTRLYVAPNGSDSNAGTSDKPFLTINKSLSAAQPGDEVIVRSGTYGAVSVTNKKGLANAPILLTGESTDPNQYPKLVTSGDAITLRNSSWIFVSRLRIENSASASIFVSGSDHIVVRHNVLKFHRYGVLNREFSHHLLIEDNEMYQFDFAPDSANSRINKNLPSWSSLKGSDYEGGGYTSFGGAGMIVIRRNNIHDAFNGVYMCICGRSGNYLDANMFVYDNAFTRIVDDPFEPESPAYNQHFFNNVLTDTHRMVSLEASIIGPIFIYNNVQLLSYDITREAGSGRQNSAIKRVGLTNTVDNVYFFNNSMDLSAAGINGQGIDFLNSSPKNFHHYNNAYKVDKPTFSSTPSGTGTTIFDYDISNKAISANEAHGLPSTDPGFVSPIAMNFKLQASSAAKGKGREVTVTKGFINNVVIPAGQDLGAYQGDVLHSVPHFKYETPTGGDYSGFGSVDGDWFDKIAR